MKQFRKFFPILLILIASILAMMPKFTDGLFNLGADGQFHASIILGYREMFQQHRFINQGIIPIIGQNLGYGTPMFYGTIAHMLTAFISLFISGPNDIYYAMDIVYLCNFFVSGLGMYLFAKTLFNSKRVGIVCGIIYLFIPYHLSQIYTCDAYSQIWVFAFLPFIFLGIVYLLKGNRPLFYCYFVPALTLCLYNHFMTTVFICVVLGISSIICYAKVLFSWNNLKHLLFAALLVLGLSAPIYFNLIYYKLFGNYRVFVPGSMTLLGIENTFISPQNYFIHNPKLGEYLLDTSLQWISYILMIIGVYSAIRKPTKTKLVLIISGIIYFIVFSTYSPLRFVSHKIDILQSISRLLPILYLTTTLWAGIGVSWIIKTDFKANKIVYWLIVIVVIIGGMLHIRYSQNDVETNGTLYYYRDGKAKTNEQTMVMPYPPALAAGNDLSFGAQKEYLPVGGQTEGLGERQHEGIKVLTGNAQTSILENFVPDMVFSVNDPSGNSEIELPRIFYEGYELKVNDHKIPIACDANGFVSFKSLEGDNVYVLHYKGNLFQRIGRIIRFISIIVIIGICGYYIVRRKRC